MKLTKRALVAALILFLGAGLALAQPYPARPVRIIGGVVPGGGLDFVARLIAPKLADGMGQPIVVDNRPGASGAIALELTARATPDGHTLVIFGASQVIYAAINKTSYNLFKDFAPIGQLGAAPYVLVVHPPLPAKSVGELAAYAKANPGKLNYASSGAASLQQLATEHLASIVGVQFTHVPYKGVGAALPDLASGRIQMTMSSVTSMLPHIRAGTLRPLAVTSATRAAMLPQVPTMIEAGIGGFVVTQWQGLSVPTGTPRRIIERLHGEVVKALQHPDVAARLANDGTDYVGSSPKAFATHLKAEHAKWVKVAEAAGIKTRLRAVDERPVQ